MGAMQNNSAEKNRKTNRRGSVDNKKRLGALLGGRKDGEADWGECTSAKLHAVVILITELGGAVTIGLSRDKGAHSLTLMLDGERETLWFNRDADLDAELDTVVGMLEVNT